MESSNSPELGTDSPSVDAASTTEVNHQQPTEVVHHEENEAARTVEPAEKAAPEKSFAEKMKDAKEAKAAKTASESAAAAPAEKAAPVVADPAAAQTPAYVPNYKYKAFGKEKDLDPAFHSLVKDPESEKKVKDVFTRADAFDDMKGRYENVSQEHQRTLTDYKALDADVRRITGYLNKGDLDNAFASLRISDQQLLQHLQNKAELARMSPQQQQAYNEAAQYRAQQFQQQEQMGQLQAQVGQQAVLNRTMQLDMTLNSPHVAQAASSMDAQMGQGAFRQLVIDTAQAHYLQTKEDLSPAAATQMVLNKFGKLLSQPAPQAQTVVPAAQAGAVAPQAPVSVNAKPVIPSVQGRGASPIKQAPKSIDDLKRMGKAMLAEESARGQE